MTNFKNKKTGKYKSAFEASIRKKFPKGTKVEYEAEFIQFQIPALYLPDFVVTRKNGSRLYVEVKGWFRPEDKRKMAAVIKCNPSLDIRMIFPSKSKKNARWCEKHGVPFAINEVPKDWLE